MLKVSGIWWATKDTPDPSFKIREMNDAFVTFVACLRFRTQSCPDTLTMTVLRTMLGPKSSFITPEKRAKLRSNPVKVHFAEEVEVNGHTQGNSLLFLPNVLKVYLENGQTKAFKFEPTTTVKDIVMTLKEKLSLSRIEHFSLVLEQQHSISKLLLLHDEERIQQTWGIENFVSSTLLRNMREKDLRKAIGYHMKKSQSLYDPKQKGLSVDQTRINYLEELSELKSFGGKSFGATMMLQDRESMVTLLVGARHGVSQIVNHKLSILSSLTEFTSITRIELLPESEKVSLVKIYLQDIKHRKEVKSVQDCGQIEIHVTDNDSGRHARQEGEMGCEEDVRAAEEEPSVSDSCHTDSRVLTSVSSDTLDGLEEDDLISCSSSSIHASAASQSHASVHSSFHLHPYSHGHVQPHLLAPPPAHSHPLIHLTTPDRGGGGSDARCYYNICSNITPDSARSLSHKQREEREEETQDEDLEPIPILHPPPGFGDSSSDEEFFDARDRFTSPEDLTSGAVPRGDLLFTVRTCYIIATPNNNGRCGGGRETLFQLRKRSRKRRSFMETDYTSRVSYPEPDPDSDPEPSEQTKNPSPTVSSLTHSEGEPAQLESKPILSTLCSRAPGFGSLDQPRDPNPAPKTRKQEMEMEPDAMESKSVTDLVKSVSPTITVVRCRVDPDGKESADRRGDGKEEGEGQEQDREGKEEGKPESAGLTGNGPFSSHMFLQEIIKEEEEKKEGVGAYSSSLKRPLVGVQAPPEIHILSPCLPDGNKKGSNGLLVSSLIAPEMKDAEEYMLKGPSYSPPPPPPSSPLPSVPVLHKSQSGCVVKEEEGSEYVEIQNKITASDYVEHNPKTSNDKEQAHVKVTSVNDDDAIGAVTVSDEVTDSTTSDNVFDDDDDVDEVSNSLSDRRDDRTKATKCRAKSAGQSESQIKSRTRIHSDYTRAINSITAKLGAATSAAPPTFNSGVGFLSALNQTVDKPRSETQSAEDKESLASSKLEKTSMATITDLAKQPTSPTHFLFQTCSPAIMGRLSVSTLRGKIQQLPLYLSRSQESLSQPGIGNVARSPAEDTKEEAEVTIKVTDVNDVKQNADLEVGNTAESVESDDSDTTVTGSEVDGEVCVELTSAKSLNSGTEVKEEVSSDLPVQTEPKPQHRNLLYSGSDKDTPGPITEPPASIVSQLQRDAAGLKMDTPGPIKDSPEPNSKVTSPDADAPGYKTTNRSPSIPPAIVVTTENLNGPRLPFQPQKIRRTSSDRPLIDLCRPSEKVSGSPKTPPSGCRVFTICEDSTETKAQAEVVSAPPLKSEFGCGSVLSSGCESIVEGVQVPLDACGCPAVYTNCFGSEDSFDDELTVYEFSCRTQSSEVTQTSGAGLPLMSSSPVPSFLSPMSSHSPSFPRSILFSTSTSELSPLLSPLSDTSDPFTSQTHKDTMSRLGQQRYPEPPTGFQVLRLDVDQLLSILESSNADRSVGGHRARHPRETCPAHFTENKRVLQMEARRLMSGCQKVVGIGQSPEEMLHSLANSFRTLVELAGVCLWFSGCDRCDRRNAEAVAGLADVARSFRDFCLAAERASSKRSCQDLSTKLLAKQCTALTASVFCLTQLFRTLTTL
uniref:FERM domain-containing protein n=1 Tax=Neolamprologus brichardi TaxID=32507 RepID=A0A3Q4HXT5_NEOBR